MENECILCGDAEPEDNGFCYSCCETAIELGYDGPEDLL